MSEIYKYIYVSVCARAREIGFCLNLVLFFSKMFRLNCFCIFLNICIKLSESREHN